MGIGTFVDLGWWVVFGNVFYGWVGVGRAWYSQLSVSGLGNQLYGLAKVKCGRILLQQQMRSIRAEKSTKKL